MLGLWEYISIGDFFPFHLWWNREDLKYLMLCCSYCGMWSTSKPHCLFPLLREEMLAIYFSQKCIGIITTILQCDTVQCLRDIRTSLNLTSLYLTRCTVLDVLYMVRQETNFRSKVNTPQKGNKILFAWEKKHPIQWESKYGKHQSRWTLVRLGTFNRVGQVRWTNGFKHFISFILVALKPFIPSISIAVFDLLPSCTDVWNISNTVSGCLLYAYKYIL